MIDQNSQFFAMLTAVGEAKHANAIALGLDWMFTEMGVGDANGTDPIPDRLQTQLINEWRRAPINQIRVDPANASVVITEQVIPADVGGKWIREIGLYDVDGDLVAVANCAPSYKPLLEQGTGKTQVVRMNFIVSSSANITLKIDPAVVLATREYVDLAIVEALAKLDGKQSVLVATTAPITLENTQSIDGVALVVGDRVLVKDQAQAQDNGLYLVASGAWTRAADADANVEVTPGLFVPVERGTVNGDSVWQLVSNGPITLGTTALQFEMLDGRSGVSVGTYRSVSVDAHGRVIAGTNPTTLDDYGITDALAASNNLSDVEDVAEARDNLDLGSVATHDAGVGVGQVPLMVDRGGLGGFGYAEERPLGKTINFATYAARSGEMVNFNADSTDGPPGMPYSGIAQFFNGAAGCLIQRVTPTNATVGNPKVWQRSRPNATDPWGEWDHVWDSSNLVQQTSKLDTTANALMQVGAFGLGGLAPSLPGDDFNAAQVGGEYTYEGSTLNRPDVFGAGTVGVMIHVERVFGNLAYQEAREKNGKIFYRFRTGDFATGTWGAWQIKWDSSNLVKQTSAMDDTPGRVLLHGAFGLGSALDLRTTFYETGTPGEFYGAGFVVGMADGGPAGLAIPGLSDNSLGALTISVPYLDSTGSTSMSRTFQCNTARWTQTRGDDDAWGAWVFQWDSTNLIKQTSAADDTPGCVLLAGAYGWGHGGIVIPDGTDLNTIVSAGVYRVNTGPNVPSGGEYSPMLVMVAQDVITQLIIGNQSGVVYTRGCITGGAGFGPWNSSQSALGFTPVQQGGGANQIAGKIFIGFKATTTVGLQVDVTDFGDLWCDFYGNAKVRAAIASFSAYEVGSHGLFRVYGGVSVGPDSMVAGANLHWTDCQADTLGASPSGTWRCLGHCNSADGQTSDSVTVFVRVA